MMQAEQMNEAHGEQLQEGDEEMNQVRYLIVGSVGLNKFESYVVNSRLFYARLWV